MTIVQKWEGEFFTSTENSSWINFAIFRNIHSLCSGIQTWTSMWHGPLLKCIAVFPVWLNEESCQPVVTYSYYINMSGSDSGKWI